MTPEFVTLSNAFVCRHHDTTPAWQKVRLKKSADEIDSFKTDRGFEQTAQALELPRPRTHPDRITVAGEVAGDAGYALVRGSGCGSPGDEGVMPSQSRLPAAQTAHATPTAASQPQC